jgi:hypothetical protein
LKLINKEFTTEDTVRAFTKGLFGMDEADTLVVLAADKTALRRVIIGDTFKSYGMLQFVAADVNRLLSARTEGAFNEEAELAQVPKRELEKLKEDQALLEALFAAGVNNWDGFSEARKLMNEE